MDCIVHGVTKSRTRLSDFHFHTYSQPSLSLLCLFTQLYSTLTLWTVNPLSMGFFRQGYWSELPFPSPGDLSDPGIEPQSFVSLVLQADSLPMSQPSGKPSYLLAQLFPQGRKERQASNLCAILFVQAERKDDCLWIMSRLQVVAMLKIHLL